MYDRTYAPLIGIITSLVTWDVWQNITLSFMIAFIGGVAAWVARKLCDELYQKYKHRKKLKPPKNETGN